MNEKFSPRFYEPYEITKKIEAAAYWLLLPFTAKIHPVFHESQLKKQIGQAMTSQPLP